MKCIFAISETIEDLASSRASTGRAVRPAPGDGHLSPDSPAMPAGGWILPMNDPTKPDKLLYTPEEARIALGISPRKLWGMTASGEVLRLRLRRLVRYPVDDLRAWINARNLSLAGLPPRIFLKSHEFRSSIHGWVDPLFSGSMMISIMSTREPGQSIDCGDDLMAIAITEFV